MMRKVIVAAVVLAATSAGAEYSVQYLADEMPIEQRVMTESEFRATPEYKTADVKGRLLYHKGGYLKFTYGAEWEDRTTEGKHNPTIENQSQVGLLGACFRIGGKFPDGRPIYHCRVLNTSGRLESTDHGGSGEFYDGEYNPHEIGAVAVVNGVVR
jgi:hypothetical protein